MALYTKYFKEAFLMQPSLLAQPQKFLNHFLENLFPSEQPEEIQTTHTTNVRVVFDEEGNTKTVEINGKKANKSDIQNLLEAVNDTKKQILNTLLQAGFENISNEVNSEKLAEFTYVV